MTPDSIDRLLERFAEGDRGALARLLSFVENNHPKTDQILDRVYPNTGKARTLGVTGPPGGGKSTLVNALIAAYRSRDVSVAVIAIDPSSAISGGAALGDRIRMLDTWQDAGVYVRSMASRGQLGGLSLAVASAIHLLDAFGFDVICVETVGVGQAEVDIARIADTTLLVQVPGLGDSVQLLKAGVLEVADILIVNKADRAEAAQLARDLQFMVRSSESSDWTPPVVRTVATTGEGIDELMAQVKRHEEYLDASDDSGLLSERSIQEVRQRVLRHLLNRLDAVLAESPGREIVARFSERELTPSEAERAISEMLINDLQCARQRAEPEPDRG